MKTDPQVVLKCPKPENTQQQSAGREMKQMLWVITTEVFTELPEDLKGPERSERPQLALGIDRLPLSLTLKDL